MFEYDVVTTGGVVTGVARTAAVSVTPCGATARTRNAYVVPFSSPEMVTGDESAAPGVHSSHTLLELGRYHTACSVTAAVAEFVHDTIADASPATALSAVGDAGFVSTLNAGVASEHPYELQAFSVMEYVVPPTSPPSVKLVPVTRVTFTPSRKRS
jgi:hypothetical protein